MIAPEPLKDGYNWVRDATWPDEGPMILFSCNGDWWERKHGGYYGGFETVIVLSERLEPPA